MWHIMADYICMYVWTSLYINICKSDYVCASFILIFCFKTFFDNLCQCANKRFKYTSAMAKWQKWAFLSGGSNLRAPLAKTHTQIHIYLFVCMFGMPFSCAKERQMQIIAIYWQCICMCVWCYLYIWLNKCLAKATYLHGKDLILVNFL